MNRPRPLPTLLLVTFLYSALRAAPLELDLLRQQYDKVHAERVSGPHETAFADLTSNYGAGLDRAIGEAKKSGDLKTVLALDEEKQRLSGNLPIPETDDESAPEALKKLRPIYRQQLAALMQRKTESEAALLPAYLAELKELEIELTKADRVAEAREVLLYRETLVAGAPVAVPPSTPAMTGTPPTAPSTATTSAPPVGNAEASRGIVEWAVKNGHTATVETAVGTEIVVSEEEIPQGSFDLIGLQSSGMPTIAPPWPLFRSTPNLKFLWLALWKKIPVSPQDISHLSNLENLVRFEWSTDSILKDQDAFIAAMPIWPKLESFIFNAGQPITDTTFTALVAKYGGIKMFAVKMKDPVSDAAFASLQTMRSLEVFRPTLLGSPLTRSQADILAGLPKLAILDIFSATVVPLEAGAAARLKNITNVAFHYKLPDGSLAAIAELPNLESLLLRNLPDLKDTGLEPLASTKLKDLNLEGNPGLTDATITMIAARWPDLNSLRLVECAGLTPNGLAALAKLEKLESVVLARTPAATDAILTLLAELKKLKTLTIKETAITVAGLEAFKKQRPDVKIVQ